MVALVTGASRGLGLEVARQLGATGWRVIAGARDPASAKRGLHDADGVEFHRLDVTDQTTVDTLRQGVDRLDLLINNAGVHYDSWQSVLSADLEIACQAFATNTLGAWRVTMAFSELLRASPHGRVVNVSAGAGTLDRMVNGAAQGLPSSGNTPAYTVSKAALNALTLLLAEAFAEDDVLVNAVNPGWLATGIGGPEGGPVEDGARGVVWVATLPDGSPNGTMFRNCQPAPW